MRLRIIPVLSIALASVAGCYPYHHEHYHHHGDDDALIDACVFGACLTDNCLVNLCDGPRYRYVEAPRHHHGPHCGCPARWEHGEYVYWFDGHWEFEDGEACPW